MINTRTLTCSHCGSAEFARVASNEYRCKRCDSVTLVEDDVAARLEQLLLSIQRPQMNTLLLAAGVVGTLAVIAVLVLMFAMSGHAKRDKTVVYSPSARQAVPPEKIKIEPLRKVYDADGSSIYLVGQLRNESALTIPGPAISTTLYNNQTKLETYSARVAADYLLPGEYSVFKIRLTDDVPYTRYTTEIHELYGADIKPRALLSVQKNQLVQSGKSMHFIGIINNPGKTAAKRVHVNVMLYDSNKRLIGFGDGAAKEHELKPGEQTAFQVNCELFGRGPVATYDYLVESERQL